MTTIQNRFPLLTNPTIINLDNYTNQINNFLEKGIFISEYKTYDKEENNLIKYICFDIHSNINCNGICLNNIIYHGNLVFIYNKKENFICIEELPSCKEDNNISIFTSDILSIILKLINKYVNLDDIILVFKNSYQLMAIDNKLEELLPQIKDNINYNRMINIFKKIRLEETKLSEEVLAEKKHKDKEERIREKVIAKKSRIYGIDRNDYDNYLEYLNAVNKRICEVCDYKIINIKRHLEANKRKYIANLKSLFNIQDNLYLLEKRSDYYNYNVPKEIHDQVYEYCKDKYNIYDEYGILDEEALLKNSAISDDITDFFCNLSFEYDSDSENKNSLISRILDTIPERDPHQDKKIENELYGIYAPISPNHFYQFLLNGLGEYHNIGIQDYKSLLFAKKDNYPMENIKKAIDLLLQINSLQKQLEYYEQMRIIPENALLQFKNQSNAWNSILNFPYWIRLGRDLRDNRKDKEKFYLLMIKPNTKEIDLNNIRIFTRDNGKEFGTDKRSRQEYLKQILKDKYKVYKTDRILITIPKSLDYQSILKLIDFAQKYSRDTQYLCESPDVAVLIKHIIFDKAISEDKMGNKFFKGKVFISIDPDYYSSFMIEMPSNTNFWHRYDYTGNYQFRRKEIASFDYVIEKSISNNTYNGITNYEKVSEEVLGDYFKDGKTLQIDITEFLNREEILYREPTENIDNKDKIYTYK